MSAHSVASCTSPLNFLTVLWRSARRHSPTGVFRREVDSSTTTWRGPAFMVSSSRAKERIAERMRACDAIAGIDPHDDGFTLQHTPRLPTEPRCGEYRKKERREREPVLRSMPKYRERAGHIEPRAVLVERIGAQQPGELREAHDGAHVLADVGRCATSEVRSRLDGHGTRH